MNWLEQIPDRLGRKPDPSLSGPHASGKTECMIQTVMALNCPSLVIISWPWEINRWKQATQKRKEITIQTPERLARTILEKWGKSAKKDIHWEVNSSTVGIDPASHAKALLKTGVLTPDTAHWLLKDNLSKLLQWKTPIELIALDNPCEWEPETREWISMLPYNQKLQTKFEPAKNEVSSVWLPCLKSTPSIWRWIQAEFVTEGAGQWIIQKIDPKKKQVLIIQTEKDKWDAYLKGRGIQVEIRHAAECEGRFWDEALIPNLKQNWGSPTVAKGWLDLVASRCISKCLARIHPQETPNWIPKNPNGNPFLVWPVNSNPNKSSTP